MCSGDGVVEHHAAGHEGALAVLEEWSQFLNSVQVGGGGQGRVHG